MPRRKEISLFNAGGPTPKEETLTTCNISSLGHERRFRSRGGLRTEKGRLLPPDPSVPLASTSYAMDLFPLGLFHIPKHSMFLDRILFAQQNISFEAFADHSPISFWVSRFPRIFFERILMPFY
jgi:hypothetical protein